MRLSPPWLDDAWRGQIGDGAAASADEERIRVEASWGRWLWLVAELVPNGVFPTSLVSSTTVPCHQGRLWPLLWLLAELVPDISFDLVCACIALLCQ